MEEQPLRGSRRFQNLPPSVTMEPIILKLIMDGFSLLGLNFLAYRIHVIMDILQIEMILFPFSHAGFTLGF